MYISATTTLVGWEEAAADALFTLASDWSETTAKSELNSNTGLEEHVPAVSICQECGASPWSSWARGTEQEDGIKLKAVELDTTHTYNLTRPKALLHVIPCVSSDKNSVKKGAAASNTAALVAL